MHQKTGFTLLEILIVLGIIAALAGITFVVFSPATLFAQARDSQRIHDLTRLDTVLGAFRANNSVSMGNSNTVYVSLPDASPTCASWLLPQLAQGWTYQCVSSQALLQGNGTGWIPANLAQSQLNGLNAQLSLDPLNNQNFAYFYLAQGSDYELVASIESAQFLKKYARTDGGVDDTRFEIGSSLLLWSQAFGTAGKWNFDTIANGMVFDQTQNGNAGTVTNATSVPGIVGNALGFNGTAYVQIQNVPVATTSGAQNTVAFWMKWDGTPNEIVIGWNAPYGLSLDSGCLGFNVGNGNVLGIPYTPLVNSWNFIAAVFYNGVPAINNVALYLNGVSQPLQNCHGSVVAGKNVTSQVTIGASGQNQQNGFTGSLDELQITSRALSAQEIWSLYLGTKP